MMRVTGNKYALVMLIYAECSLTSVRVLNRLGTTEKGCGQRQIPELNIEDRERINNLIGMLEDGRRSNAFA